MKAMYRSEIAEALGWKNMNLAEIGRRMDIIASSRGITKYCGGLLYDVVSIDHLKKWVKAIGF